MKRALNICMVVTFLLSAGAAQATVVQHMAIAKLTGCQTPEEVVAVVEAASETAMSAGGMQIQVWQPLHHTGFDGKVLFTFRSPDLVAYGKQMDEFPAFMEKMRKDAAGKRLSECVRMVGRSAEMVVAGPEATDATKMADLVLFERGPGCSDADHIDILNTLNAWMRANGFPERGLRKTLFGPDAGTVTNYGYYDSFQSFTKAFHAYTNAEDLDGLKAKIGACGRTTARVSGIRLY